MGSIEKELENPENVPSEFSLLEGKLEISFPVNIGKLGPPKKGDEFTCTNMLSFHYFQLNIAILEGAYSEEKQRKFFSRNSNCQKLRKEFCGNLCPYRKKCEIGSTYVDHTLSEKEKVLGKYLIIPFPNRSENPLSYSIELIS